MKDEILLDAIASGDKARISKILLERAAPDLLTALNLLVTHADPDTHDGEYSQVEIADLYRAIADARAALAKARGE
jgi:hypothetical protein